MSYNRTEAGDMILKACEQLVSSGLIARTWGNVSARLSEEEFLITPSGRAYETLTPEELVVVRIKDHEWEGDIKPSSEKGMHAELYKVNPEWNFIVHTHQTNASALSVLGEDLKLDEFPESIASDEDKAILGSVIPCAKYGLSSTKTLADNVAKAAKKNPGSSTVLMKHHGAVVMGRDDEEAFRAAFTLEEVCGRIYEKKCGEKIATLTGESVAWESIYGNMLHVRTPYVMEMSKRGRSVPTYLDDMAMISGSTTECVKDTHDVKAFRKALGSHNAVLIRNDGAICVAADKDEVEAVALVLEKNCQAANLGLKKALKPVGSLSGAIERRIYVNKYSKLKNAGGDEDA
ncbi:MAG: class II aldolase/adducin family protein [Firmicutes bacterium]|nr:class II aldolase/adducin family protein [Bacillota bacterium]